MTWDELVFRPLTADPFIYKGTGDVDPVEEPGGGEALRPDVEILRNSYTMEGSLTLVSDDGYDRTIGSQLFDPEDPLNGIPLGGRTLTKKCRPTMKSELGIRRNLVLFPPLLCTRTRARIVADPSRDAAEREQARNNLVGFYRRLRNTCFNKLLITEMSIEEIRAAIAAGWKLNDMILEVQCCEWCEGDEEGCNNQSGGPGLRNLLLQAQDYYRQINGADDPNPGFYQYFFDEPYSHKSGFGKCPENFCTYEQIVRFMQEAQRIDEELNGGIHTAIVLGRYCIGFGAAQDCCTREIRWERRPDGIPYPVVGPCQSEFDDFGRHAEGIQADGFAYTGYQAQRQYGQAEMLQKRPDTSAAKEHTTIWFSLIDDQHFIQTGKDAFGRPVLMEEERYSNFMDGITSKVNTVGFYAGHWDGTTAIYNIAGQKIGNADPCRTGSIYRRRWPDPDECKCNVFFNFLKDFESAAITNGLVEYYYE